MWFSIGDELTPVLCCLLCKVHELQALRQQLEPDVDIPQLQPLRDEVERLDALLQALHQLQVRVTM